MSSLPQMAAHLRDISVFSRFQHVAQLSNSIKFSPPSKRSLTRLLLPSVSRQDGPTVGDSGGGGAAASAASPRGCRGGEDQGAAGRAPSPGTRAGQTAAKLLRPLRPRRGAHRPSGSWRPCCSGWVTRGWSCLSVTASQCVDIKEAGRSQSCICRIFCIQRWGAGLTDLMTSCLWRTKTAKIINKRSIHTQKIYFFIDR